MLKALLQQLLIAFRGSHKSVPFYRSTIYQTGQFTSSVSNQTFLTYTAPSDGYLVLQIAQDTSVEYVMLTMRRETLDIAQAYNGDGVGQLLLLQLRRERNTRSSQNNRWKSGQA